MRRAVGVEVCGDLWYSIGFEGKDIGARLWRRENMSDSSCRWSPLEGFLIEKAMQTRF